MGKIAFLYAGQGSQYPGMGQEFYDQYETVKALYDQAESMRPGTINQCFAGTKEELSQTVNTQPCLYLTDLACAMAIEEEGIKPDVVAGFSLGEIAALAQAGLYSNEAGFSLVCTRGELMDACAKKQAGEMIAVLRADQEQLEAMCAACGVYPVNYNCPGQIAVSGDHDHMEQLRGQLTQAKIRFVPLAVSGPFHTPYMKDASEGLKQALEKMTLAPQQLNLTPVYANLTGNPYEADTQETVINTLSAQVCNPVRFETTIRNLYAQGVRIFVECGPGETLSGFVKRTFKDVTICHVSDKASLNQTLEQIKQLEQ